MERIPEPDLMDEAEQARAYSEADFAEPHDTFVELAAEKLLPLVPDLDDIADWLDLGCGPADITCRWALRFTQHHIDGVDGADAMLHLGRDRVERQGLSSRIRLHRAFLPADAAPASNYRGVFSNSLLHHLQDPLDLWRTMQRDVVKGAPVFVMDLMRPHDEATVDRFVTEYAAGEPEVLQKDFRASLFAAYTLNEVRDQLQSCGLGHLQVEATSDRHLIVYGRL